LIQLNDVVRFFAMFGGVLARKGDGEHGVKTIWQGMQRVDFSLLASGACAWLSIRLVCNGMP
jgi:Transposase Tn5 dimerisation domain